MVETLGKQSNALSLADRLGGAVWGHLIGDALGVPYEFMSAQDISEVKWGARGSHDQPPGTWSDDGGLMLALLDSLLSGPFDPEDQARRAVAWLDGPDYKPGPVFDIGGTTGAALRRFKAGVSAERAGGASEFDNGNGSLMRILPVALVGRSLPTEQLFGQALRASRVTHAHPRAQVTCAVYCLMVRSFLAGNLDRDAVLGSAFGAAEAFSTSEMRPELDRLRQFRERSGSGHVLDCFWSAWDSFRDSPGYPGTIEPAIRYGQDTDTTAAVAGGLAGTYWGLRGIPVDWMVGMQGRHIVVGLAERLTASA